MLNRTIPVICALVALVAVGAPRSSAGDPAADVPFNPAFGAIRASGSWKQTTFVLITEDGRGVALPPLTSVPYGSDANTVDPPDYGPRGFWKEVKPGKYTLIAVAPGKSLARASFEVEAGQEVWLNARLDEGQSKIAVSEPLNQKTGSTWSKATLAKVKVRWREQ